MLNWLDYSGCIISIRLFAPIRLLRELRMKFSFSYLMFKFISSIKELENFVLKEEEIDKNAKVPEHIYGYLIQREESFMIYPLKVSSSYFSNNPLLHLGKDQKRKQVQ